MPGASVQPPDQEVEGGAGSAASGWTPLGRSALGVRVAAGAADEGREAEPRWAAGLPGGCACGRGGGREAARAAGAEVGAAVAGEAASSPGDAASEGTRVDAKPSTPKGARFQPALSFRPEVQKANFWVGKRKDSRWASGLCGPWTP